MEKLPPRKKKIDRSDLFWLAYLIFFIIQPIASRKPSLWIETVLFIGAFLALYFKYLQTENPRHRLLMVILVAGLGALALPHNGGAVCFYIYAAALLPFALTSTTWTVVGLVLDGCLVSLQIYLLHLSPYTLLSAVFFILVVGGSNIFFAQKERADCKLRMAHEEIEALAAVAERERIARDLHDVLGHTLTVIMMKAELAGRLLDAASAPGTERARAEIADVEKTSRTALAEVREAIGGYRSKGLAAEIDNARRTLAAAGVALLSDAVDANSVKLSAPEETVLALALREAVTNIVRHARATECHLRFALENGRRRLIVEDNGEHAAAREGNGLRGMRERVEALGGRVQLERERGTRLLIELPLAAEGAAS